MHLDFSPSRVHPPSVPNHAPICTMNHARKNVSYHGGSCLLPQNFGPKCQLMSSTLSPLSPRTLVLFMRALSCRCCRGSWPAPVLGTGMYIFRPASWTLLLAVLQASSSVQAGSGTTAGVYVCVCTCFVSEFHCTSLSSSPSTACVAAAGCRNLCTSRRRLRNNDGSAKGNCAA